MNVISKYLSPNASGSNPESREDRAAVHPETVDAIIAELEDYLAAAELRTSVHAHQQEEITRQRDAIRTERGYLRDSERERGVTDKTRAEHKRIDEKEARHKQAVRRTAEAAAPDYSRKQGFVGALSGARKLRHGSVPGTVYEECPVTLPEGSDKAIVADARANHDASLNQLHDTKNAPPKMATLLRSLPAKIRGIAEGPVFEMGENGNFSIGYPKRRVDAQPGTIGGIPRAPDALALLCWHDPEGVTAELTRQIEAYYQGIPLALDTAEKRAEIARLHEEILEAERIECAAIWRHIRGGGDQLWFRPDADPMAVLGIRRVQ